MLHAVFMVHSFNVSKTDAGEGPYVGGLTAVFFFAQVRAVHGPSTACLLCLKGLITRLVRIPCSSCLRHSGYGLLRVWDCATAAVASCPDVLWGCRASLVTRLAAGLALCLAWWPPLRHL